MQSWTVLPLVFALVACGGGDVEGGANDPTAGSVALASIDPAYPDDADLAAFGAAVGDSRIVVLTESMHQEASTMLLNARLARYLHEAKGFDLLLIESGLFDVAEMRELLFKRGISYQDSSAGRAFFGFSRTTDGRRLFAYIDSTQATDRPLELAGLDIVMGGVGSTDTLLPRLQARLATHAPALLDDPDWPVFVEVAQQVTRLPELAGPPAGLPAFRRLAGRIADFFCAMSGSEEYDLEADGFWCRTMHSLTATADYLWNIRGNKDYPARDRVAAANAIWLLEGPFKGKKAIVLTHAFHGLVSEPRQMAFNTGMGLAARYPGQVHTVLVSPGRVPGVVQPPARGALEFDLDLLGGDRYLAYPADEGQRRLLATRTVRETSFMPVRPNNFGRAYQSFFYLRFGKMVEPDWTGYPVIF